MAHSKPMPFFRKWWLIWLPMSSFSLVERADIVWILPLHFQVPTKDSRTQARFFTSKCYMKATNWGWFQKRFCLLVHECMFMLSISFIVIEVNFTQIHLWVYFVGSNNRIDLVTILCTYHYVHYICMTACDCHLGQVLGQVRSWEVNSLLTFVLQEPL